MSDPQNPATTDQPLPQTCLPEWEVAELPEPRPLGLRNLAGFIGPGIVMCGIQIGGGEWLFGPGITARYGGGLMWIATVAILCQVFYNIECGRYALYSGEPVFTGFMRTRPGPRMWVGVAMLLSLGALIPGLSTNAAVLITSLYLDRPASGLPVDEGESVEVVERQPDGTTHSHTATVSASAADSGTPPPIATSRTDDSLTLSGRAPPDTSITVLNSDGLLIAEPVVVDGRWSVTFQDDSSLVTLVAYLCLGAVVIPVLLGGKVYNVLQVVMTAKVFIVLGFCLFIGVFFVSRQGWIDVFSGFVKFGNVPVAGEGGQERVVNAFAHYWQNGEWPLIALTNIALLGAFAGYAGGGGLSNSTYSNFVRDKGWGMGSQVGAIPSAVGSRSIQLSHIGKVFRIDAESLRRWKGWWKYIITDQAFIWAPGCFMGMALPALMSIEFARYSPMYGHDVPYAQPLIVADGIRHAADLGAWTTTLWLIALFVGLMVFLPSQMAIVDDFSRRWTDIIWSSNARVRQRMHSGQVKYIYYGILSCYVLWSFISATIFLTFGNAPTLMVTVIANLNNVALGVTAFHVLYINRRFLPPPLRPRWYSQLGIVCCGVFYLGLATLVFFAKVVPMLTG